MSYNGWTNRETWATALHLSNSFDLYNTAKAFNSLFDSQEEKAKAFSGLFAHWNSVPLELRTVSMKLALEDIGDLSKVNWQEVADSLKG